jgi:hypothetical protein
VTPTGAGPPNLLPVRLPLIAVSLPFPRSLSARALPLAQSSAALDVLLIGGFVGLALVVRWTHLFSSPPFPAVGQTALAALAVSEGRSWPLVDQAPYLGAPFIYLLAAVYRVFGPSLESTMVLAWLLGALTIIPTYLLGRQLGGPIAASVAAVLLATSPAHTVISSHVPWVHSLTPGLAALSLWLLIRAETRHDARALLLSGLAMGLTLQTHPTAFPLLLGAGIAAMVSIKRWRNLRLIAVLVLGITLGYAPLLANHLQTRFQVVGDINGKQARYLDDDVDANERADRGFYFNNLEQLTASLVRMSAGELRDELPSAGSYLRDPRLLVYPLLGGAGLLLSRRQGSVLLLGLTVAVFLPPLLNGKYKPILDGRYLMPLVPVVFVGVGCFIAQAGRIAARSRAFPFSSLPLVLLVALLSLSPMARLGAFYEEATEDGASNALYLSTLARIREARQPGQAVWMDPRLKDVKMPAGASAWSTFSWLLPISGVPLAESSDELSAAREGQLLITQKLSLAGLRQSVDLEHLDGLNAARKDHPSYRLVRARTTE